VDPVRVKVYGLVSLTRRRYLYQAAMGGFFLLLVFISWIVFWPDLGERLAKLPRTPWIVSVGAVLAATPWILLTLVLFKCVEMYFVLRRFAEKEAEAQKKQTAKASGGR
jgi:hypothetical protein